MSYLSISALLVRHVNEGWVRAVETVRKAQPTTQKSKGDMTMKFMILVKHAENSGPPPKELMDAINIIAEEAVKNGTMLGNGGLAPTAQSTRVRVSKGKLTVTDGPFTEAKEVIGGYAQFELKSKEEAVKGAVRFMELHRKHWPSWEGEAEVRQIFGPEDFAHHINEHSRKAG
jgi:hypothetical protein